MKILLKYKSLVLTLFAVLTILCAVASLLVGVNYNLMDYLPEESPSTIALNTMREEYDTKIPNARAMINNVSIAKALEYKERLFAVDGVDEVSWLDDAVNIYEPIEVMPKKTVEEYYKNKSALFTLTIDDDKQEAAVEELRIIIGDNGALSGDAVNRATATTETTKEIKKITVLAVLLVFAILILTTESYFEPVLFLMTIGVAVMLSRGTNLFFGEISFVTNAAGSILQLAVSMDYSIFLLHSFQKYRKEEPNVEEAMNKAVKTSFGSVMSSGLTTVMGFAALVLMKFKIGPDMGYVMAKAIAISLFCVLVFMPSLILSTYKLIDKTTHRPFIPKTDHLGKIAGKIKRPALIAFAILLIPCYMAQGKNVFTYGQTGIYGEGTRLGDDTALIEEIFGQSNLMVVMVPKGDYPKEEALSNELKRMDHVTSVLSYAETVGIQIPEEMVPLESLEKLVGRQWSRLVITLDVPTESDRSFQMVEEIRALAKSYYPDYLMVGETVNSYDLRDVVTKDTTLVNALAIASIALILLFNFQSLTLPILLLMVIELSIWMNLTVPYFAGERLFYIGYLIISSIQLGATVDYAILFADNYLVNRKTMDKRKAAELTLSETAISILTSASIMTSAGLILGLVSSNGVISQLGILVGRGAVLSAFLVLIVLPGLLTTFDKVIQKTTRNITFTEE